MSNGFHIVPRVFEKIVYERLTQNGVLPQKHFKKYIAFYQYLFMQANYNDFNGLKAGEVVFTSDEICSIFCTERRTIKSQLDALKDAGIIEYSSGRAGYRVKFLNYGDLRAGKEPEKSTEKESVCTESNTESSTDNSQKVYTLNNKNINKIISKNNKEDSVGFCPTPPDLEADKQPKPKRKPRAKPKASEEGLRFANWFAELSQLVKPPDKAKLNVWGVAYDECRKKGYEKKKIVEACELAKGDPNTSKYFHSPTKLLRESEKIGIAYIEIFLKIKPKSNESNKRNYTRDELNDHFDKSYQQLEDFITGRK